MVDSKPRTLHEWKKIHSYRTELSTAARNGDVENVSSMLARKPDGTDLNYNPKINRWRCVTPPLFAACETDQLEVVKLLLKRKDLKVNTIRYKETPLSTAAERGYVEVMKLLIENGANVDYVGDTDTPGYEIESALHKVAHNSQYEAAVLLIERGASVNCDISDQTPLLIAARRGNTRLVKLLLDSGADMCSSKYSSPLILACREGHTECAQLLIQRGANVNDANQGTPLTVSIMNNHKECVKLLYENGADVNKQESILGATPLMVASQWGNTDYVQLLLDYGADVNISSSPAGGETALGLASDAQVAELLIENGADVNHVTNSGSILLNAIKKSSYHQESSNKAILLIQNGAKSNVTDPNSTHYTPLRYAVEKENMRIIEELLTHGATVDVHVLSTSFQTNNHTAILTVLLRHASQAVIQDETITMSYSSLLAKAVRYGDFELAKLLLRYKPNIDIVHNNTTALIEAAYHGRKDFVKLLVDHGAQVNLKNSNGDTALIVASQRGDMKCIEHLLGRKDIDANLRNRSESSAITVAAQIGHNEIVKLLLDHGAQANLQNINGDTALMIASQRGHTNCVEHLLLRKDIDVNLQNSKECTALMLASENGHTSVVDLLLANNANLEILTTRKCSALFYGVKSNSPAVVQLLLDKGADVKRKTLDRKDILQFAYECHKEPDHHVIEMLQEAQAKTSQAQDGKPTLKEAFQLLFPLAHEWHNIGVLLGIPDGDLNAINADNAAVRSCLREMLRKWLSCVDPRPTWSSLAEVVEPFDPRKVEEIHQKYCSKEVSPASETHQPNVDQDSVEDKKEEAERNDTKGNTDSFCCCCC